MTDHNTKDETAAFEQPNWLIKYERYWYVRAGHWSHDIMEATVFMKAEAASQLRAVNDMVPVAHMIRLTDVREIQELAPLLTNVPEIQEIAPSGSVLDCIFKVRAADLIAENHRLSDQIEELRQTPWPDWATNCLSIVRSYTGYDGSDDWDGADLPREFEEALSEVSVRNELLESQRKAMKEELASLKSQPLAYTVTPEMIEIIAAAIAPDWFRCPDGQDVVAANYRGQTDDKKARARQAAKLALAAALALAPKDGTPNPAPGMGAIVGLYRAREIVKTERSRHIAQQLSDVKKGVGWSKWHEGNVKMANRCMNQIEADLGNLGQAVPQDIFDIEALNDRLRKALALACNMLFPHEPGDSRAVSDWFVALTGIASGFENEACWDVVDKTLKDLEGREVEPISTSLLITGENWLPAEISIDMFLAASTAYGQHARALPDQTALIAALHAAVTLYGRRLPIPQSAGEAEMMEKMGLAWLAEHAQDRLTDHGRARSATEAPIDYLAAAAPDLLASCIALDEAMCAPFNVQTDRSAARQALIQARAAVAKAKGIIP